MMRQLSKLLFLLCFMPLAWAQNPAGVVARVALSVGAVQLVSPNVPPKPLLVNQTVSETDRIITGNDAMVILVFVDQGRVALRANSELLIKRYTVDPAGTHTTMQLELVHGAMRQISGDAAQLQPDRYRLNTPVAAIGVRGTDFLAKVSGQTMETYIQDGTIVLLPLHTGANTSMAPLATLSSADAGRYAMVLGNGVIERRSISPEDINRIFGIRLNALVAASSAASEVNQKTSQAGSAPVVPGTPTLHSSDNRPSSAWPDGSLIEAQLMPPPPPVLPAPVEVAAPAPVPVPVAVPNTQLIWGKFSNPLALPMQLPVPYAQARLDRHVTVGEFGQYALWAQGVNAPLSKGLNGQAEFGLNSGEAYYQGASGTPVAMTISDPRLSINFDTMRFSTQLGVAGAGVPSQQLDVNGKINDQGIFLGKTSTQNVGGALSRDGTEAGYLFNINAAAGNIQGLTLWGVR
jgi:hypothetical protein